MGEGGIRVDLCEDGNFFNIALGKRGAFYYGAGVEIRRFLCRW